MGQTPETQGSEGLPEWALALIALVIIVAVVALLAWFTGGPGEEVSDPPGFSPSPSLQPTPSPTGSVLLDISGARAL